MESTAVGYTRRYAKAYLGGDGLPPGPEMVRREREPEGEPKLMRSRGVKRLALAAMFLAIGLVLPFLTGQIQVIGKMLLPMHIPVFLCAFICGWQYGLAVGAVLPILRSLLFFMPPMYPAAIAMTFELATYGLVAGLLYSRSRWQCVVALYRSLIIAMLAGRAVWGAAEVVPLGLRGNTFTWQAFLAGAFTSAVPGIILQLILIPAIMVALDRTKLVRFHKKEEQTV